MFVRKEEKLRVRIDLKILIFLLIFYFTNQLSIYLTIMLFSILHEIGHIAIGIILKMKPEKLEIMSFGISVTFDTNNNSENKNLNIKETLVALAGPITSLILAMLAVKVDFKYISKNDAIYSNLLILFFNLLPIYPLDGGRILKGILKTRLDSLRTNYLINKISYITMIILTVISSITVYYYQNIAIFFICIFLWIVTLREKKDKTLDILQGK